MKPKFIEYYMKFAELTSTLSHAKRLQVGAVIVKGDNQIIATGYNGTPTGWDNACEEECVEYISSGYGMPMREETYLKTKPETLHSEMNALMKVAKSTESSEGATLFCTHAPCMDCAKLIYQAGISTVYYKEKYREDAGIKFLMISGVNVHQHPDSV
jgi:dCMP deaminase